MYIEFAATALPTEDKLMHYHQNQELHKLNYCEPTTNAINRNNVTRKHVNTGTHF